MLYYSNSLRHTRTTNYTHENFDFMRSYIEVDMNENDRKHRFAIYYLCF